MTIAAPKQWRVGLDLAHGEVATSHVADDPALPAHEHHVTIGLTRAQLRLEYGLRENMQLALRLPYDVKGTRVNYTLLGGAPYTPPYGDIHHRTETLRGISDPSVTLDVASGTRWIFGAGTTLPIGNTVADPIRLGAQGLTHQHLQFGSGTIQPILAAQFAGARFVASAEAKLSLYENGEGFRAPSELTWSAGPTFHVRGVTIDPRLAGQRQGIGRWNGEIDEGSGFHNGGIRLQLSVPFRGTVIAPSIYRELWSHGMHHETFEQRTTLGLSLLRTF
jgi:hypothetical protein